MCIRFSPALPALLFLTVSGAVAQPSGAGAGKTPSGKVVVAGVCRPGNTSPAWANNVGPGGFHVALNSLLEGCAVNLMRGSGFTATKSELRDVTVTGDRTRVDLFRCVVDGFTLSSGFITARDSLITGTVVIPAGDFSGTTFVKAKLSAGGGGGAAGGAGRGGAGPGGTRRELVGPVTLNGCHFEKCEVPLSWAARAPGSTFQECDFTIDNPEEIRPGSRVIRIVGSAGPDEAELIQLKYKLEMVAYPAVRFWSPWRLDASGGVITEHAIGLGPERAGPCDPPPADTPAAETAAKVEGAVYGGRGVAYRLAFREGKVEILARGETESRALVTFEDGGRVYWRDAGKIITGWFSSDYSVFSVDNGTLVCERENAAVTADVDAAANVATGEDLARFVLGSTWEFPEEKGKRWLRFETPGYCVWTDSRGRTGAGNCHPLRKGVGLYVKDWPETGGGTTLLWNAETKSLTVKGGDTAAAGTLASRRAPGAMAVISPGGGEKTVPAPARKK